MDQEHKVKLFGIYLCILSCYHFMWFVSPLEMPVFLDPRLGISYWGEGYLGLKLELLNKVLIASAAWLGVVGVMSLLGRFLKWPYVISEVILATPTFLLLLISVPGGHALPSFMQLVAMLLIFSLFSVVPLWVAVFWFRLPRKRETMQPN